VLPTLPCQRPRVRELGVTSYTITVQAAYCKPHSGFAWHFAFGWCVLDSCCSRSLRVLPVPSFSGASSCNYGSYRQGGGRTTMNSYVFPGRALY
jgi:hypothetical protein